LNRRIVVSYVDTVVTVKLTKPWKPEIIIIVWNVIGVQGTNPLGM